MGLRDFVGYIQDRRRRSLVESVLDAFQKEILDSKVYESFSTQIIHGTSFSIDNDEFAVWFVFPQHINAPSFYLCLGDFNDANMLIDKNYLVSGVIDFGDSVER